MQVQSGSDINKPSSWFRQAWTTTPADYNILANGPGYSAGINGTLCKKIHIVTAGTLVITDRWGTAVTLTCAAGEDLFIEAASLASTSTAQGVKIYW
jgi:hypothetical protein